MSTKQFFNAVTLDMHFVWH